MGLLSKMMFDAIYNIYIYMQLLLSDCFTFFSHGTPQTTPGCSGTIRDYLLAQTKIFVI